MTNTIKIITFFLIVVGVFVPSTLLAGDGDWDFELAPMYLWAVAIDGDQTAKGNDINLDVSFGDIWDNLGGVFTIHFEGLYQQKWGFFLDYTWVDIDIDGTVPPGVAIELNDEMTYVELGGYYRLKKDEHDFDFLAGLRYTDMDMNVTFKTGPIPPLSTGQDWTDPIVGARWIWHLADHWDLWLRGDIGGFGVGSDFTWNAIGMVQFKPWQHVALFGGYRALYQDYEDGSGSNLFKYDATLHGPVLGLNIVW